MANYRVVTDGGVTRMFDIDNPASKTVYEDLIEHNTGFDVAVDDNGYEKNYTQEEITNFITANKTLANIKDPKVLPSRGRTVKVDI